jgi:hypothetical protein
MTAPPHDYVDVHSDDSVKEKMISISIIGRKEEGV